MFQRMGFLLRLLALLCLSGAIHAETVEFPKQPISLLVPYAAGGPSDSLARVLAKSMTQVLGQPVNVSNMGGKGGTIGSLSVAKAPADGYTLLFHHIGQASSPFIYNWMPYNVVTDFEPVGLVADLPMTLVARNGLLPNTLEQLIDFIKVNEGKLVYGDAGRGSASHLCAILLMRAVGAAIKTESYDGTSLAMRDLIDGKIDLMCDQTANTLRHIGAGRIKAYAQTGKTRLAALPDLPTVGEAGREDLELVVWNGIYAPRGTPKAVIATLAAALRRVVSDSAVARQFAELGAVPVERPQASPEGLRDHLYDELDKWSTILLKSSKYVD